MFAGLHLQKLSSKSNLERSGWSKKQQPISRDTHLQNIETNSSFGVK